LATAAKEVNSKSLLALNNALGINSPIIKTTTVDSAVSMISFKYSFFTPHLVHAKESKNSSNNKP